MTSNNNPEENKPFSVGYSLNQLTCRKCYDVIELNALRIAPKVLSPKFDGYWTYPWYHAECIFKSFAFPKHWDQIENFYLTTYEDQLKIARLMNFHFDPSSDIEKHIKQQTDEFFEFLVKVGRFEVYELQNFMFKNHFSPFFPFGLKKNLRVAEFLTFGVTKKCPKCSYGNLCFENNVYQCRCKNDKHKRCMFTTHTPERTECILTREFSEVFPDYVPRVQDRVMRIVENYESAEEELEEKENLEPAPKKMKIFYKKGATNDSGSDFNDLMHVFKTDEGILYACTLTKTDLQLNQNKFYKLKILKHDNHDAFWLLKEWGRTGTESGSERFNDEPTYDAMTKEKAIAAFERKFQELTGNFWKFPPYPEVEGKYVYLKTDYKEEESEQLIDDVLGYHNLDKPVEDLVKLMFSKEIINQTLMEMEIDAEKMPLGMLSKSNLDEAQQLLLEIENDLENGSPDDGRFTKNTKSFYHLIPHGSDIQKPLPIINSIDELYQKMQLIEDLRKIEVAFKFSDENLNPILENYHNLETEITSIDRECDEFEMIREYCKNTFAPKHSKYMFEIEEVFKIDCSIDKETFNQHKDSTNRMLLWHGSKIANFASILKNGLRVSPPSEVHQTGKMFGCGIYFADIVSKSVQYVDRYENNKQALLLLSEVALGDKFEVTKKLGRRFTKENLPEGKTSIKAIGKTSPNVCEEIENGLKVPLGYLETDNEFLSDVQFNEYVVFDESRIKMRFLVRIRFDDAGSD